MDTSGRDTVRCLYPDSQSVAAGLSENNLCLVLEVATPDGRALLPGDLEALGEARLLALQGLRPCALLKVGHHGSRTSTTPDFLTALERPVAVISVGLRNGYHHPSPEVEHRLREEGCVLHETRFEGAVLLGLGPTGVHGLREEAWEGTPPCTGPPKAMP
jgi:competence protein ComEC